MDSETGSLEVWKRGESGNGADVLDDSVEGQGRLCTMQKGCEFCEDFLFVSFSSTSNPNAHSYFCFSFYFSNFFDPPIYLLVQTQLLSESNLLLSTSKGGSTLSSLSIDSIFLKPNDG